MRWLTESANLRFESGGALNALVEAHRLMDWRQSRSYLRANPELTNGYGFAVLSLFSNAVARTSGPMTASNARGRRW